MRYIALMNSTSVRVDHDTLERLKALSDRSGMSVTKLIMLASIEYIKKVETEGSLTVPLGNGSIENGKKKGNGK